MSKIQSFVNILTDLLVQTKIKIGVSICPCGVENKPARAFEFAEALIISKLK